MFIIQRLIDWLTAPRAVRIRFRDSTAIQYRMRAGFAGDVNRTHPAAIEPEQMLAATPPTEYGQPVLMDASGNGVRPFATGDASDTVAAIAYGFTARPFPTQQATATTAFAPAAIGPAVPPSSPGIIDVLRMGLIMAQMNPGSASPVKGGRVFVWCAATTGSGATLHTQGGLESAISAGNTVQLDAHTTFNGAPDSNGVVEVAVNI
jgi:hypothetical protein